MRWKFETPEERRERLNNWHEIFAWWPRYDYRDGHAMWLEKCLRRHNHDSHTARWWDYRPIAILPRDLGITEPVTEGEIEGCSPPPKKLKKQKKPPIPNQSAHGGYPTTPPE